MNNYATQNTRRRYSITPAKPPNETMSLSSSFFLLFYSARRREGHNVAAEQRFNCGRRLTVMTSWITQSHQTRTTYHHLDHSHPTPQRRAIEQTCSTLKETSALTECSPHGPYHTAVLFLSLSACSLRVHTRRMAWPCFWSFGWLHQTVRHDRGAWHTTTRRRGNTLECHGTLHLTQKNKIKGTRPRRCTSPPPQYNAPIK